jgi:hypothetical protein
MKSLDELTRIKNAWQNTFDYPKAVNEISKYVQVQYKSGFPPLKRTYFVVTKKVNQQLNRKNSKETQVRLEALLEELDTNIEAMENVIQYYMLDYIKNTPVSKPKPQNTQPPSEKQLSYLKGLGCNSIPNSKQEATALIDSFLSKRLPSDKQPPSDKQLSYLKILGCRIIPKSKQEGMNLISEYVKP